MKRKQVTSWSASMKNKGRKCRIVIHKIQTAPLRWGYLFSTTLTPTPWMLFTIHVYFFFHLLSHSRHSSSAWGLFCIRSQTGMWDEQIMANTERTPRLWFVDLFRQHPTETECNIAIIQCWILHWFRGKRRCSIDSISLFTQTYKLSSNPANLCTKIPRDW